MVDFNRKTKQILDSANHGRIGIRNFKSIVADVAAQIQADAGAPWLELWGQSRNIDENENAKIVDPKILNVIGRVADTPIRNRNHHNTYHAGLMHTYGYLFSRLKTRYGYKRERWTSGVIESGLKLPPKILSPSPDQGTLLSNVTFVLTQLLIATDNKRLKNKPELFPSTPTSLLEFPFDKIKSTRIVEVIKLKTENNKSRQVKFLTDLISFRAKTKACDSLLVYSLQDPDPKIAPNSNLVSQKLITCFPISQSARQLLIEEAEANEIAIRARYNAVVDGFPAAGIMGQRLIEHA